MQPLTRLLTQHHSHRAAALLADNGVRPGMVVPVLLPPGPELVAALLAITRLGAGYAALDPEWPDERVRRICSMLSSPVVVTDEPSRVGQAGWDPTGLLDGDHPPVRRAEVRARPGPPSPDAVFCVFFTSGSTGEPKGIPATRRAVAGLLRSGGLPVRFDRSTVMTVASPAPWDMFAFELWGPLLNGGTCLLMPDSHLTPGQLRENVARHGQNLAWLTSSLFNLFVEEDIGAFGGITQVVTGGERLSPDHVREFLRAHPGIRLFNDYGPAENCIVSTMHAVTLADCDRPDGIPIGRPESATTVWIRDGDRTCRPGELGEICLAGPRLSPGYLGDPELTRRAFVTANLNGRPARIYRTGDLGWRDEEGSYHFHGRTDRQVKVRGHRIEPAEIERHVAAHPAVTGCVVVPVLDPAGTVTGLTACYQARDPVSGAELGDYLRGRLPGYLVPERWLAVGRIPLLRNGKADLDALRTMAERARDHHRPRARTSITAADPLLAEVQCIVGETTHLAGLAPGQPLIEAGANSLQLIRACVRVSRRWGVHIEPARFFTQPTIAQLAGLVRHALPRSGGGTAGQPVPGCPLNMVQYAMLLTEAADPATLGSWNCTLGWRIHGPVDEQAMRRAIHRVHRRHPALHARYPVSPPFLRARCDPPTEPDFTVLPCAGEDDGRARVNEALYAPFRLDRGPAWRAVLALADGDETSMLGIAVHHVAFDDWSEHILARDLAAAYAWELSGAAGAGRWFTEPLPWPAGDVVDAARLDEQRQRLARGLAGAPPLVFPPPADPPPPGSRAGRIARVLDAAQTARCYALASEHATTPFVVGLAGYAAAASRLTGLTDFPVAVPVAQRHAATEDAVGCLLNLLCVRLRLPDAAGDPRSAIAAAKHGTRQALLSQDVPFPEAAGQLGPRPGASGPALPYLFVLQQDVTPALDLPGCRASLYRPPQHYTGFECQVELRLPEHETGEVVVTYRRADIDDAFGSSLAEAFVSFLTSAKAQAGRPVGV